MSVLIETSEVKGSLLPKETFSISELVSPFV